MQKYFTIEEATKALTLVRPIVMDILHKMQLAQQKHEEVKIEKSRVQINEVELLVKLREAEKLLNEIEYHMKELESIGVLLKDLRTGFVDFPCLHAGRIIYLCWIPEENSVSHWHEVNQSSSERKIIDSSFALSVTTV